MLCALQGIMAMDDALRLLLLQFLHWVAREPRLYAEAMEAWRTSCPRLPAWEEAMERGLVRLGTGSRQGDTPLLLTEAGQALLREAARV